MCLDMVQAFQPSRDFVGAAVSVHGSQLKSKIVSIAATKIQVLSPLERFEV